MGKIIGIDLGTTNSCVAVLEGSSVQIIPSSLGGRTTPSIVAFAEKGDRLLGQIAKRQMVTNAGNTIYAVKRLMGRRFDSPEIQRLKSYLTYQLTASDKGDVRIAVHGTEYSPPEISAMLLQHLKSMAEDFTNEAVTEAIITVPAYFDDSQRQATKDAGRIAGLEVRRIINEPTAAALAYGLGKKDRERVAIFDLGGGTFDISILELNNGVFEVLSTCGDSFLGGEDFDQRIMDWMIAEFKTDCGINLGGDILARQRLKETAEKAKCELSTSMETHINLPFIAGDSKGPKHFDKILTRAKFEGLVQELIERTTAYCHKALSDAKLTPADIDKVILVGGQTRTPAVQRHVEKIFCESAVRRGESGRGGSDRRRSAGRSSGWRAEGNRPARCVAPFAWSRDPGRAFYPNYRAQLYDSAEENHYLHYRRRQPGVSWRFMCFRVNESWRNLTGRWRDSNSSALPLLHGECLRSRSPSILMPTAS